MLTFKSPHTCEVIDMLRICQFFLFSLIILTATVAKSAGLSDMSFIDQENRPVAFNKWAGQFIVLSFVYASCPMPEMCPLTMAINKKIHARWIKKNKPFPLHFAIATLDPEEDGPKEMKEYADANKAPLEDFSFLTGSESAMADLASFFDSAPIPGGSLKSHKVVTVLLGPNLEVIKKFTGNKYSYENIASAVRSLKSKPTLKTK